VVNILDEDTTLGDGDGEYERRLHDMADHLNEADNPPDWSAIFDAPDLTAFVKPSNTAVAREYRQRMESILKAGLMGALNTGQMADAAAILAHGPGFASATGQLADADERARRAIDLITAPASPLLLFAMTAIPLVAQLVRNHEKQVAEVPQTIRQRRAERKAAKATGVQQPPRFTFKVLGRSIPVRFRMRFNVGKAFGMFRAQTADPDRLAFKVFSDPKLVGALQRQGFSFRGGNDDS
jgi:hypothetical protein